MTAVEMARRHHPWYAELVGEGDEPPLLTRPILDAHYYETAQPQADDDVVFTTSGTASGVRRRIVWSAEELRINNELKLEVFRNELARTRRAVIDTGLGLAAHSTADVFREMGVACVEVAHDRPIAEHIAEIARFRPDTLYSMPSLVDELLRHARELPAPIERLVLIGEICTTEWRAHTAARLGIAPQVVLDTYGCVETGLIAARCGNCDRFHFTAGVVPEVVTPSQADPGWADDAVRPDEAVLVLTTRYRTRMPIVRYVTYDLVRGFGDADCAGRARLGFDALLGRLGDEVKHGERISVYDIEKAMISVVPEARYQVVQDEAGRIAVEVLSSDLPAERQDELRAALTAAMRPIAEMIDAGMLRPIDLRRVAELTPTAGGVTPKKSVRRISRPERSS